MQERGLPASLREGNHAGKRPPGYAGREGIMQGRGLPGMREREEGYPTYHPGTMGGHTTPLYTTQLCTPGTLLGPPDLTRPQHRWPESRLTALERGVAERTVTDERFTVVTVVSLSLITIPVSLLVSYSLIRRPGTGCVREALTMLRRQHAHHRHPFHCWTYTFLSVMGLFLGLYPRVIHVLNITDYSRKVKKWWLFPVPLIPGLSLVLSHFLFYPELNLSHPGINSSEHFSPTPGLYRGEMDYYSPLFTVSRVTKRLFLARMSRLGGVYRRVYIYSQLCRKLSFPHVFHFILRNVRNVRNLPTLRV